MAPTGAFDSLLARRAAGGHETLLQLQRDGALYNVVVTEVDGRRVRAADGRWLVDFASCNYLGLDLDPEVAASIAPAVARYGTHPSWARLAAGPDLYGELEAALAELVGAEEAVVLPTISLIAVGLIPALVGPGGVVFVDRLAHKVNHDGCRVARDRGASLVSFPAGDLAALERALEAHAAAPDKLVVLDGVLSTTGRVQDVPAVAALAARHGAIVYVDDAHGLGVVGEGPSAEFPYGRRGNGVVRHLGGGLDNVVYVAGLSKAYSSLAAFFTCPRALRPYFQVAVTSYVYSGPCPTASLATSLAGLRVNARDGDARRAKIYALSRALGEGLAALGYDVDDNDFMPIQGVRVGSPERVVAGGRFLYERGFLATMQAYPVVPRAQGTLRFTVTSANTDEEVASLLAAMRDLRDALRGLP
ncbi:MAG: pyridoxal phosphate-dependent aminotransferase family protein [Polyangiales bacterium]